MRRDKVFPHRHDGEEISLIKIRLHQRKTADEKPHIFANRFERVFCVFVVNSTSRTFGAASEPSHPFRPTGAVLSVSLGFKM